MSISPRRDRLCTILCLLLLPLAAAGAPPRPPFIRGMALGQYADISERMLQQKLKELHALGVSHVSLVVSWAMKDVRSSAIAPRPRSTTPDPVLQRMIQRAHAMGLKVFLFPILDVRLRQQQEWRGVIRPPNWDDWWRSYRRFILHYAALAAASRVELFCVGSELVSTERMRDRWEHLIKRTRKVYPGKIAYSANWDHYTPVRFWDLVDVIGLTAYYKLAQRKGAMESEMMAAWQGERQKLISWSRRLKRPFVFTEVGYPSIEGCAAAPWDYTIVAPASQEEQRRAYAAFTRTWSDVPELQGVFFWDWYGDGGPQDRRYTPRGKPAAHVIKSWFARMRRAAHRR